MKPKNRRSVTLPVLRIEIEDATGVRVFDPNGLVMGRVLALRGGEGGLVVEPIPDLVSEISGAPAVKYRADDFELCLTPEELYRLIERDLRPHEYHHLIDTYGVAHEWHEDFYDEDGIAFQPMRERLGG